MDHHAERPRARSSKPPSRRTSGCSVIRRLLRVVAVRVTFKIHAASPPRASVGGTSASPVTQNLHCPLSRPTDADVTDAGAVSSWGCDLDPTAGQDDVDGTGRRARMRIAVAGGTGTVGRPVVAAAQAAGHQVTVLSRSHGVDVTTGRGLDAALDGVASVIDVTNRPTTKRRVAVEFFETASTHLLEAGRRAWRGPSRGAVDRGRRPGRPRLLRRQAASGGGRPRQRSPGHGPAGHAVPRVRGAADRARSGPAGARCRGCAASRSRPSRWPMRWSPWPPDRPMGRAPELAGPEPREMSDLVRLVLRARGVRRVVLPLRVPGAAGRAMACGALLPTAPGPRGRQTFEQWLAGSVTAQAGS